MRSSSAMRGVFVSILCLLAAGCVYPRRTTSLTEVRRPDASQSLTAPDDVWRLTIVEATIVPNKSGGLPWDEGDGAPDAFVRVFRGAQMLFETPVVGDSLNPHFDAVLPANVRVTETSSLRFEVWDQDPFGSDPIGSYRSLGRPSTAMPDADARLALDAGSALSVRFSAPRAHRGVGIEEYELQPGALVVLRVHANSPASRAGVAAGDRIVRIGDRAISSMSATEAASALSMSISRDTPLVIQGARGERTVELDHGYVWLTM